jgi:hypothetical protein
MRLIGSWSDVRCHGLAANRPPSRGTWRTILLLWPKCPAGEGAFFGLRRATVRHSLPCSNARGCVFRRLAPGVTSFLGSAASRRLVTLVGWRSHRHLVPGPVDRPGWASRRPAFVPAGRWAAHRSRAVFGWGEAVRFFFFEREAPGLIKCGFHQNSTLASAISTRYRVGLGGVAFVPPGAICALLSGAGAVWRAFM